MQFLLILASFSLIAGEDEDVVYPRMIVSRSGKKRVQLRAFDQDFHLKLEPINTVGDNFVLITRDEEGLHYTQPDIEHLKRSVYQDSEVGATISIDDDGPLRIKGIINHDLRIEPHYAIHKKNVFSKKFRKDGGRTAQKRAESFEEIPHRVTRVISSLYSEDGGNYQDEIIPPGIKGNSTEQRRQSTPLVVEMGVVSDTDRSQNFASKEACILYHIIQTNAVNIRYKSIKKCDVTFRLVALKINNGPIDQPYIENNMADGCAAAGDCIADFASYCSKDPALRTPDIVKLIMKRRLGSHDDNGKCDPGVIGIAYVGGVCDQYYKYGASEDNGVSFDGTDTISHECAHLLGAPHDGDPPVSYIPKSPGSISCPWNDGYAMSYIDKDEKHYIFSACSEACICHLATLAESGCMFKRSFPDIGVTDNRLPGQYMKDAMGQVDVPTYYRKMCEMKHPNQKISLYWAPQGKCSFACDNGRYYWVHKCLDGDPCDANKICKIGHCV